MKKIKTAAILVMIATLISVTVTFAGCNKTQQSSGTPQSGGQNFSVSDYKQQLDEQLASLVQDGTITSAQETEIIDAYAKMFSNFAAKRASGSGPNGSKPSGSAPSWSGQGGNPPSGSKPSGSMPSGSGSRPAGMNPLSSLVKNKAITQAQADAVSKLLQQNGGGMGGGQGQGQNQSQSQSN